LDPPSSRGRGGACDPEGGERGTYLERRLQRSKGETAYQGDLLQVLQFCSPETPGPLEAQSRTGLGELCRRWLRPETHSKEQIVTILPEELQARVREQRPESGEQAVAVRDEPGGQDFSGIFLLRPTFFTLIEALRKRSK